MDKALDFGSKDCGFESRRGLFFLNAFFFVFFFFSWSFFFFFSALRDAPPRHRVHAAVEA